MQGSVTVTINANPEQVWDAISDITRIGEFSPETFEAKWVDGATGPAVGARFKGHVRRNGWRMAVYWTECRVSACDPPRDFAFEVLMGSKAVNTWSYHLEPTAEGGTAVTESYQLDQNPLSRAYWALTAGRRGRTNERGMRQTLERVKAAVEG